MSAERSHTMCMKTATINPAFSSMNTMISVHRRALDVEIVDEVGEGAENEQQSPDLE